MSFMKMNQFIEKLKTHFLSREFIWFLVIGSTCTVTTVAIAYCLRRIFFINGNLAFNLGYMMGISLNYYLQATRVWFEKMTLHGLIKFALSYIPNYIIQNVIVFIFFNCLGLPDWFSYCAAAGLAVPITFLCIKIFAFGRKF